MIVRILWDGLWQGGAIVALALLVLRAVPRRNATTRYAVWFVALAAIVVVPVLSVLSHAGSHLTDDLRRHAASSTWTISLLPVKAVVGGASAFLAWAARWIVIGWMAGAAIGLLSLFASLVRIGRIRRRAVALTAVQGDVLVSEDVDIPIAVGFLKPAIVIPKTLLRGLDPADLERIVAHERGHIRRRDMVGNLIQRLIEAVLFFNPWVHLVGRNLVLEREAACDAWAIEKTGGPDEYAAFLASLARRLSRPHWPLATPSALGSHRTLLERIERIGGTASHGVALNYYVVGGTVMIFVILSLALEAVSPAFAYPLPASGVGGPATRLVAASCAKPNVDARVTFAAEPNPPRGIKVKASATAVVTIARDGSVVRASISKSRGNAQIDRAVLDAAQRSKYAPKVVDCQAVQGTYLFFAEFAP
ncbi:MAG TPA: M56 family metallopeptidase [Candidatus Tumulicola sp.]|jgi:TonB family protein